MTCASPQIPAHALVCKVVCQSGFARGHARGLAPPWPELPAKRAEGQALYPACAVRVPHGAGPLRPAPAWARQGMSAHRRHPAAPRRKSKILKEKTGAPRKMKRRSLIMAMIVLAIASLLRRSTFVSLSVRI